MRKIIFVLFAVLLSGCANMHSYEEPKNQPVATIHGFSKRSGLFDWEEARISTVNNKTISYAKQDWFGGSLSNKIISITPGAHDLVITSSFNRNYGSGGPYEAILTTHFNAKSGENYSVHTEVSNANINVWITDVSGEKVSPVVSKAYYSIHRDERVITMVH